MPKYKIKSIGNGFWGKFAARMMSQRNYYKNENKRLHEALQNILEEEETHLEGYETTVYKLAKEALEGDSHAD